MKVIKEVEKIIKSNDNFKLVEIDKEYHNKLGKEYQNFRSVRIEIRDKENVYVSGFAGCTLEEVLEIFDNQYS